MRLTEEAAFAALLALPGVSGVGVVRSQGSVKHYTVSYVFKDGRGSGAKLAALLGGAWPFGSVVADPARGVLRAEFLVRPEEVPAFRERMSALRARAPSGGGCLLLIEFAEEPPEEAKERFLRSVRAEDRLEWDGRKLRAALAGCGDAGAVERRLLGLAGEAGLAVVDVRREAR